MNGVRKGIKKHNIAFLTMVIVSILIWSQMILYAIHEFLGIRPAWGFIEYCLSLLAEKGLWHKVVFVVLNVAILYSFFMFFSVLLKQIKLEKRWNNELQNQCNWRLTDDVSWKYGLVHKLMVIDHESLIALTSGFLRPQIVISAKLLDVFSEEEVAAVLFHEQAHARRYDPLRLLCIEIMKRSLPFVPIFKRMSHYIEVWTEIEADAYAIRKMKTPYGLASMLYKSSRMDRGRPVGVGFADRSINYRLQKLLQPRKKLRIPLLEVMPLVMSSLMLMILCVIVGSGCS